MPSLLWIWLYQIFDGSIGENAEVALYMFALDVFYDCSGLTLARAWPLFRQRALRGYWGLVGPVCVGGKEKYGARLL